MMLSQHCSRGAYNAKHNTDEKYRATLDHVDKSMSAHNVVLHHETVKHAYRALFDDAVKSYNARQKRSDRKIGDYYEKVVGDSRGHKGVQNAEGKRPVYETIVGIGNLETMSPSILENRVLAERVYSAYLEAFRETFPNLHIVDAVIHMDEPEGGIHMHLAWIPWGEGYKRGMERQQSLSKACENMHVSHMEIDALMRSLLEEVCLNHGIERLDMENHEHHKPTPQYKREQRELEAIRAEKKVAKTELEAVQHEVESARNLANTYAKVANQLDDLVERRSTEAEEMRIEIESLKGERSSLEAKVGSLKKERGELDVEVTELNSQVTSLRQERNALEAAVEKLREVADRIIERIRPYLPNPILALARAIRDENEWGRERWHEAMEDTAIDLIEELPSRLMEDAREAMVASREIMEYGFDSRDKNVKRDEWSI